MNQTDFERNWAQFTRGSTKNRWPSLTDVDLNAMGGNRDRSIAKIAERTGAPPAHATTEFDTFVAGLAAEVTP